MSPNESVTTNGSATTGYRPIRPEGVSQTPDLIGIAFTSLETTEKRAPLSESRRRELLEELVAWAGDPNAHDWTRVDADDPYEDDGYTFPSRRIS